MVVNLRDMISEDAEVTGWLTFMDSFEVKLKYIARNELKSLIKKATETVYERHQPVQRVNDEALTGLIAPYIKAWRGLTGKVLKQMFPVKAGAITDTEEIPCTNENKIYLLLKAYGFDDFVTNGMTELTRLKTEKHEVELKNSNALSQQD